MNNLEQIKEINPKLYDLIKLKYLTNVDGMRNRIDDIPIKDYEKQLKQIKNLQDFNAIESFIGIVEGRKVIQKLKKAAFNYTEEQFKKENEK